MSIKVCIADDNRELVTLLDEYISSQPDMEVIGTAYIFLKKAAKFLPVWHRYLVKHPLKWNM
ncbi:hypothetical protein M493_12380 [Geobacillus genomosp. 3]|uniref:DNA-binding response regulator n=1 Tax=Geobacillus genomosp. 3 TaxID=1921421 RepID=S5ZQK5_GEOG3|nr:hypothetical protein M493_12380 [Geobacillus genomosp. 3]